MGTMKNQELIQKAIKLLAVNKQENQQVIDMLRRFLLTNAPDPNGKFNMYDYVSRYNPRPAMCGIFHANRFRVATDGHVLIALAAQEYPEDYEGYSVSKQGEIIQERYPNWCRVIPAEGMMNVTVTLNYDTIKEAAKLQKQLRKEKAYECNVAIRAGDFYFEAERLLKFANFAKHIGINELKMNSLKKDSAACVYSANGSLGLIMPLLSDNIGDFKIINM